MTIDELKASMDKSFSHYIIPGLGRSSIMLEGDFTAHDLRQIIAYLEQDRGVRS